MPAGRPTKLSQARIEAITDSIGLGAVYEQAARAAGIHPATLYRWKELGEAVLTALGNGAKVKDLPEQERLAATFCELIEKAEAEAELLMIEVVRNAALGAPAELDGEGNVVKAEQTPQWQAAMTYLERKHPGRWSRRIHVTDDTPREPPPLSVLTVEESAEAFALAYGGHLPSIDPANLLPSVAIDSTAVDLPDEPAPAKRNGRRNGKR